MKYLIYTLLFIFSVPLLAAVLYLHRRLKVRSNAYFWVYGSIVYPFYYVKVRNGWQRMNIEELKSRYVEKITYENENELKKYWFLQRISSQIDSIYVERINNRTN